MKKIYAKSGETILLTDHSKNVSKVSLSIMDKFPNEVKNDLSWRKVIEISSLLHDIGKSTSEFQKNLKKGIDGYSKNKFRHNEIGWAFCYRYLNVSLDILNPILYNFLLVFLILIHKKRRFKIKNSKSKTILIVLLFR